jgi:hypothetical protein
MSKYSKYQKKEYKRPLGLHPIWRGIGCLVAVILPIISYFGSIELLKIGVEKSWPIPQSLLGFVQFPLWVWKYQILTNILAPITIIPNFYAIVVLTIVLTIILSGILSLLYSIIYRMVAPPLLSDVDAPPIKGRRVKKSR